MRHYMSAMALLCLLLNPGCAQFEDESARSIIDGTFSGAEKVNASTLIDYLRVSVEPTTKPEKYMVYFSWPSLSEPRSVRIRMEQTLAVVDSKQTTFSHEVDHNQTLTYTFDVLGADSRVEKSFSKLVKVPRDFVVREGQSEFFEETKLNLNRLFLSNIPLRTNGFNIDIQTNELISEKGVIETFREGTKAALNVDGRTGGNITINAKYASGLLKVYLRGENGGDGTKGPAHPSRAPDGAAAGNGTLTCDCVGRLCPGPLAFLSVARPLGMVCTCDTVGANAGSGANGAKGNKGLPARNGGDSGNLKVTIKDGAGFEVQGFKFNGIAGIPGPGGDGQAGGLGGPGKSGGVKDCRGSPGANGAPGGVGDSGDPGSDGNLGTICVYVASEGKNDCY